MEDFNPLKCTSASSISKENQNKYATSNRGSVTHPSVHSAGSRDYLKTLFQKINSGDNVLSRIPTRLDPNIEFSDDEDDEASPVKKSPEKPMVNKIIENKEEGIEKKIISEMMKTPDVPQSSRSLFNNAAFTQRKTTEICKQENIFSKFSSASKVNRSKLGLSENRKALSTANEPLSAFTKTNVNTILPPLFHEMPHVSINKVPKCPKTNNNVRDNSNGNQNEINETVYSLPDDIIQVNNKIYNVLSLLGSGGSCKVYSVYDVQNKSRVAIKRVYLKDTDPLIRDGYKQEIEYLLKLQNSNRVIKMYDFEYRENELLLVLEHGDIDFAKYISNEAKLKRLTPLMIKFFWVQMLEAVADIHKYGIVHSDLKPANFLLVAGNLKLIDFGIATSVPEDKTSTFRDTQVGTLNYMSPEAITQMSTDSKHPLFKVGVKSDVWSLGCILYNLVYSVTPFHNIKMLMQKIYAITNPNYEIPFKPLSDPLLLDVLKLCLKRNPKERASVDELLKHPYLAEDNVTTTKPVPLKRNSDLHNVLAQMQNLTPRRMKHVTKFVQELAEKRDA